MSNPDNETTQESETLTNCCGSCDGQAGEADTTDRWITAEPVLDADFPSDVQTRLGQLLGDESVETLSDWIVEIRQLTGGGAIAVEDLCHSNTETSHWGEMAGERYYFLCFYDAVILAALADEPVDIRTESPGGETIRAKAAGTADLTVTPEEAVFSFGIDNSVKLPADGDPSPADVYAAVCPYVRAFPDGDAYEEWSNRVSAATVAMPLEGATELAAALIE
jgi:hypothetical protein